MNIWIFTSGEPIPLNIEGGRLLRSGNLCKHLADAGHNVVWWTSSFDHIHKKQRSPSELSQGQMGFRLMSLFSPGYKANVGVGRLLDHAVLGGQFLRYALSRNERPDIIWCSYPPIETACIAVILGARLKSPVVLDVRDLWPDVFLDIVPARIKRLAGACLIPYYWAARFAFRKCDGIVGITHGYLDWALKLSGRKRRHFDRIFPMGYPDFELSRESLHEARRYWLRLNISSNSFNVCFFGTLGRQFDIQTVIDAARLLWLEDKDVKIILCGQGSSLEEYRKRTEFSRNLLFPGWVDTPKIKTLMDLSALGIAPYRDTENFQLNVPNKIFEYAAGGIPILSGVDGEVGRFLQDNSIGTTYEAGNARSLATAILQLKADRDVLNMWGRNARDLFSRRYEARQVSRQIEEFMIEISSEYKSA